MAQLLTIRLSRQDAQPWGFRLQGGKDFATPLVVQKVNGGSLAENAGLFPGDAVIKINNVDVFNLKHKDAQDIIVRSGNTFDITVQRGGSTWRPTVTPVGNLPSPSKLGSGMQTVTKTSLAHKPQEVRHIGSGYNVSARPFSSVNGTDGHVKSIVNKQYNSPVGIYSEEAIAETLSAQAEVLAGGVLGVNFKKNEKVYNSANSEVYKFLHEQENELPEPAEKPHIQTVQHSPQPTNYQTSAPVTRHVMAPIDRPKAPGTGGLPAGQNICAECERLIVGVFVRIKDKNLHVECFKCATCGTSLKNQGYFNFNNKLYCDIHAKLAAMQHPPSGTEGYVPVPIKPSTKLSATTISAAINAHHGQSNGSNLIISPGSNINQGYGGPKPFSAGPKSPTISGPKSPSSYPPHGQAPSWSQPKPATNPYATLPRTTGSSQEENLEQNYEYHKEEDHHFEDLEVAQTNRGRVTPLIWPPPKDEERYTPTASPLYIPPPETQHVKPKPIQKKDKQQTMQQQQEHSQYQEISQEQIQHQEAIKIQQEKQQQIQVQQQQQQQWQSRSAPELTAMRQHIELESSSDSYTSTSTTTTTTSEEYHRMYQAQMQAYQMQQMYEQSGSEIDYHMDMEIASMQQQRDQSYSASSEFMSFHSGRRSAQECAETIIGPLSTYKLVDLVREVTPSPTPPSSKGPRKVEFADEVEAKQEKTRAESQKQEVKKDTTKEEEKEKHREDLQTQRKFQPTPEIKIEIPETKPIPPSNIPNPVPKEWTSAMVKALTTAPDKPVNIINTCPCNVPCGAKECEISSAKAAEKERNEKQEAKDKGEPVEEVPKKESAILEGTPPKGSFIASVVATAPTDPVKFAPHPSEPTPLPEEKEPYMPPPINMKPYQREDYRPKSPLLIALTTAPDRPYTPFGHDVISQLDGLPTPKDKLTMVDALTVAPDRSYTPLNPENILSTKFDKANESKKEYFCLEKPEETDTQRSESVEKQVENRQVSAFTNLTAQQSIHPFQPKTDRIVPSVPPNSAVSSHRNSLVSAKSYDASKFSCHRDSLTTSDYTTSQTQYSSTQQQQNLYQSSQQQQSLYQSTQQQQNTYQSHTLQTKSYQNMNQSQLQQTLSTQQTQQTSCSTTESHMKSQELQQKPTFPPSPGPNSKKPLLSGLHKPDNIPQYQRNWTVLPSQRPVKTPEPPELRENVPLAFVDVPRESSPNVQKPTAVQAPASSASSSVGAAASDATRASEAKTKPSVPVIVEERVGPITMTFQSIDEHLPQDHSQAHPRPFTPSLINKPAPVIPFYQKPEKLVFEECPPAESHPFDRRSASPCPDRAKSPAPGPPPNPLSVIRAPRLKESEFMAPTMYQAGSITTGQPYQGAQLMQQQQQQQGQVLSHYQTMAQSGSRSYVDKPEVVQQKQIGDMTIQRREKESHLSEEQRSQVESKTTTQVGNTQIERRRKVVEEYERTQKAKTIEIRKTAGETRQYGKTGFVANQARRLSGLEQEISSITSQSQAISARAANMAQREARFPQYTSPEPVDRFPTKVVLPPHDEPQRPTYYVSGSSGQQDALSTRFEERKEKQLTASKSSCYAATSASQSLSTSQSFLASSNQTSYTSNLTATNPVPAYKPPELPAGDGSNKYAQSAQQNAQQLSSNNNTYKPTPSTGQVVSTKPTPSQSSNTNPSVVVSDQTPASAGPSRGGVFGATSAPKRGRGILNKAVGPGVRIPLCGCCNTQVRGPFITALGRIWCPEHFMCVNANCRRPLQDIGFVEEKGDLYCEYCFERYLAPTCSKCNNKIKGDCLNAIGKHYHPECFTCAYCGKLFGNSPFFLEEGEPYCEADWNELFTTKCFACGFPVEAGDRWVEALNHNYHSQCFNCTMCKKNLEGQSFYNKGGRPFCKNHAR